MGKANGGIGARAIAGGQSRDPLGLCIERIQAVALWPKVLGPRFHGETSLLPSFPASQLQLVKTVPAACILLQLMCVGAT
jgi:hypothetical protein